MCLGCKYAFLHFKVPTFLLPAGQGASIIKTLTKTRFFLWGLCIFATVLYGCEGKQVSTLLKTPNPAPNSLFYETESVGETNSAPYVVRSRFVKINLALLLDESGRPRDLENHEITLNLFPDLTYIGVIKHIEQNGDQYSWVGSLKNIEFSSLTIIFTGGLFIMHAASPAGVYEVSNTGGDLYRIIMIDQKKFPGGE